MPAHMSPLYTDPILLLSGVPTSIPTPRASVREQVGSLVVIDTPVILVLKRQRQ